MEIKKENGKVITKMSFSECFFGYDDPNLSNQIINRFNEILLYPNQPESSKREDLVNVLEKETIDESKLSIENVKAQLGCGTPNTAEMS